MGKYRSCILRRRGQATLESLILLSGLFAFVSILWMASLPVQQAAVLHAQRLQQQAAFEKVRFAVALAATSAPGFALADEFLLSDNASLSWDSNVLAWRGPSFNGTLSFGFDEPGRVDLEAGAHRFRVRRAHAVVLAVD